MRSSLCVALWLLGLILMSGCGPWNLADLEARHPALQRVGGAPLQDITPYFLVRGDRLIAFTCRWPRDTRLRIALAEGTTPGDVRVLERALVAWSQAGLGIDFVLERVPEAAREPAPVRIRFEDVPEARSGAAAVDCRARRTPDGKVEASLVSAVLALRREALDWKGERVALGEDERIGAALHELGHALGFQGHPQRGHTVMVRSVDHVRWAGARVARGEPFADEALAALYAVPSGTVLGHLELPRDRTAALDASPAGARPGAWWWIRVGDRGAVLHAGAGKAHFLVPRVEEIFKDPKLFRLITSSSF